MPIDTLGSVVEFPLVQTSKSVERIGRGNFRTFSNYFCEVLENRGSPKRLEEGKRGPYFQKGKKELPNNYRPVRLTSVLGKVMGQIIKQVVCKHLTDNAVLNKSQHGFLRNKSCQTNLLSFFFLKE